MTGTRPRPGAHRARRRGRPGRDRAGTVLLAGVSVALVMVVAAALAGFHLFVIRSGSMTPTLGVGDLIVSRTIDPATLRPGDVVTFEHPALHEKVTHRVVTALRTRDLVQVVTKGDANAVGEQWSIGAGRSVGRTVAAVPTGPLFRLLTARLTMAGLVLLCAALLVSALLRRVWRGTTVRDA